MQHWFLSYNSQDFTLADAVHARLKQALPDAEVYFAPKSNRAGTLWLPALAEAVAKATAFVLIVGEAGVGPWQVIEYYEALERHIRSPDFPLVLLLLKDRPAPGLPFLRQLHWIVTAEPASEDTLAKLLDAAAGHGSRPGELWRYASPYRGLAAMTEADSENFFGRSAKTVEVLTSFTAAPDRLPVLLGNSGVGKSSLAQAGVLGALKRQAYPEDVAAGAWPAAFKESRHWCFLKMQPGSEPLKALVEPFLRTWQLDATDPQWEVKQTGWIEALLDGKATLRGLLDATERRYDELGQPRPPAFFLYIDQGEELYVRSEERQRRRFSELLAEAVADSRLTALMSLRADFTGELQKDTPLFDVHRKVDVPPLREAELKEVVSRPAALLSARFETETTAAELARKTADESVKDAGALPLLSYLLDDMWSAMVRRGDGVLRLPEQALELGGVLVARAEAFVAAHPKDEDRLRRVLTLKLATVREDAEPSRRRALRSEFTEEEWRLVSELADHPHRLIVTATPEAGEPYAEVAHEAIFRRWEKLKQWIAEQRDFLIWKSGLETDRKQWEAAPEGARSDALLTGLALAHAQSWLVRRPEDLPRGDREFIEASLQRETLQREERERERAQREGLRRRLLQLSLAALAVVVLLLGFSVVQWRETQVRAIAEEAAKVEAQHQRGLADARAAAEEAAKEDAQRQRALADERAKSEAAAKEDAQHQRELADARARSEAAAKEEAQRNFEMAKETVDGIVFDIANGLRSVEGMRIDSIRKVLGRVQAAVERLTKSAPGDTALQRSRADMFISFGDTYLVAGDGPSALAAFQEALSIFRKLTEADPTNTDWQREMSVDLNKVGDVKLGRGDAAGAEAAYAEGLAIRRALAKTDPGNTDWQRDVSVNLERIGDVKLGRGDAAGAEAAYAEGLAIVRALAKTDPGNTDWQRDLSIGLERVGDVKLGRGDAVGAEAAYKEELTMQRRLLALDPRNTDWQRTLSVTLNKIGDVKVGRGDATEAEAAYAEGLAIVSALVKTDPGNVQWQSDVVVSLYKIATVSEGARRTNEVNEALGILDKLKAQEALTPDQASWPDTLKALLSK